MDRTPVAENKINRYMNSFWLIEDYIFANDFLRFFDRSFKKRKKSCFLKSEKNVKYVFSNTDHQLYRVWLTIKSVHA